MIGGWEGFCDLSRGVVEDAVKAAGGGKRRNISGQARGLVRVSPLRANDPCYDLGALAKLVMRERLARRRLLEVWRTKQSISIHWILQDSHLTSVELGSEGQWPVFGGHSHVRTKRVFMPVITRFRAEARRIREFLGRALSSAKVSDLLSPNWQDGYGVLMGKDAWSMIKRKSQRKVNYWRSQDFPWLFRRSFENIHALS